MGVMNVSLICSQCGQTFAEFQKSGLLGCAGCYPAFASELTDIFKRLHGATQHCLVDVPKQGTLADLEAQLRDAVSREAYEEARDIRDHILTIKNTTL
ncbi:MAG: protein arginine kinase activator [Candidatus Latescibacterota bacterium]|jgi:protein arginine kinase activator